MHFERHKTIAAMKARIAELVESADALASIDVTVYSENAGFTFRPRFIVEVRGEVYSLGWYAFMDDEVEYAKRREANEAGRAMLRDLI